MNIAFLTWQPGLFETNGLDSAGGSFWTQILLNHFKNEGHNIWYVYTESQPMSCLKIPISKISVAIVCWRWLLPDVDRYKARNELYYRQREFLNDAFKRGIPVLVHDEDHKITFEEESWLLMEGATLAEPALVPRYHYKTLMYPNLFIRQEREFQSFSLQLPTRSLVYVGNNYERYDQTVKFLGDFSTFSKAETVCYGNWIEESSSRESPRKVSEDMPYVRFPGRLPKLDVIKTLNKGFATINLAKDSYNRVGFVTIRWAETAVAYRPTFIPIDFELGLARHMFQDTLLIVKDGAEMAQAFQEMWKDRDRWVAGIEATRAFVSRYMTLSGWTKMLHMLEESR